jgi:hypothetical protein
MPKETTNLKEFVDAARRKDARFVTINRTSTPGVVKFKLRLSRYLLTYKTTKYNVIFYST